MTMHVRAVFRPLLVLAIGVALLTPATLPATASADADARRELRSVARELHRYDVAGGTQDVLRRLTRVLAHAAVSYTHLTLPTKRIV